MAAAQATSNRPKQGTNEQARQRSAAVSISGSAPGRTVAGGSPPSASKASQPASKTSRHGDARTHPPRTRQAEARPRPAPRTGTGLETGTKPSLKPDEAAGTTAQPKPAGTTAELLKTSAKQLLQAAVSKLARTASSKIDEVVDKLDDVASDKLEDLTASGGPQMDAGLAALRAFVSGKNPVWAALKGAWSGASTKAKVIVVLCLVLCLLLAPVVLVVLLLGLVVAAIRSATR